jgi:hypothetical protein
MNRTLKYLLILSGGMLTLASPTCEDEVSSDKEMQLKREALQAVAEDFRTESLRTRNLEAFESRAKKKLMEYADYLNIVYDQDLESVFRDQAGDNVKDLFTGRNAPSSPLPAGFDPGSFSIIKFRIDSIEVISPLKKQPTETYEGSLQYSLNIYGIREQDTINLESSLCRMGIRLQMNLKDFGVDSLLVWEVLLCSDL